MHAGCPVEPQKTVKTRGMPQNHENGDIFDQKVGFLGVIFKSKKSIFTTFLPKKGA